MSSLRHISLPGVISYTQAAALQNRLVAAHLAHKASPHKTASPDPAIITAQFHPIYTCGRREIGQLSQQQIQYLCEDTALGQAAFHEALRGGQTTFHGPGQLVAYPILDLKRHNLTARCYVRYLENTIIRLLKQDFGVDAKTTENPGVWTDDMHKICAIGVHLRRNVTSHGIGLNVTTDLRWFDRIVACGLEGKSTTSLERQNVTEGLDLDYVSDRFVKRFVENLDGVDEVVQLDEKDVE